MKVKDRLGQEHDILSVCVGVRRMDGEIWYFCRGRYRTRTGLFSDSYEEMVLCCSQDVNKVLDYAEELDRQIAAERASVLDDAQRMGLIMS